jgi:DNA-binding transcriptional LysR family regulator
MNSLGRTAAAKEGAGIVRVPSWQAEADLAGPPPYAGSPMTSRRQGRCTPMFQPPRLASPKIRAVAGYPVEAALGVHPYDGLRRLER